jgi:aryl-alcohol dehydrogenase-like predicted oxidoreductase
MSTIATDRIPLAPDLDVRRIVLGMWQVSGAHGAIDPERALRSMREHFDRGFTTFDLADHYGPAEDLVGEFRRRLRAARGDAALHDLVAFTKWVPEPGTMSRAVVESAIDRSLRRMDTPSLDLLQFHWWDYADERYLDALSHLMDLREARKIRHLALTNFDTEHLERILDRGIEVVSNQVQYSLVDRRPEVAMRDVCVRRGVRLLTYGTLAGGLFSERWLGRAEPRRAELTTASLQKYKRMVDAWGGWALFQELLVALDEIARRHRATISNVAVRAILDEAAVGAVIIGVRFGESEHVSENLRVFDVSLTAEDRSRLAALTSRARDLFTAIGDCGDEYR